MTQENKKQQNKTRPSGGPGGGRIAGPGEKAKDFKGTIGKLINYIKPHRLGLMIVAIFTIGSTVFNIIGPKRLGEATTLLVTGWNEKRLGTGVINFAGIQRILAIMLVLYVASAVFKYFQQRMMARIAQNIVFKMREDVDAKLNKLPLSYYDAHPFGDILSRVTNDIDTISQTFQQSLTEIITAVITLVGVLFMMLSINWQLTLVTLLTIPLSVIITIFVTSRSQKYHVGQQNSLGALNGQIEEVYSGHNVIKAFGKEEDMIVDFKVHNDELYDFGWKAQFMSGIIMPALNFVGNLGYVAVATLGAWFSINRGFDVGYIQSFLQYSRQFSDPILQVANIMNILQSTVAAAERVFELLEATEEEKTENPQEIVTKAGHVQFEDVTFGYDEDKMIINGVNIDVKPKQMVAIVGPTGAGKTTLINLLMRFYELNAGKIIIDGVDIKTMDRGYLRSMFGMVLQDTWLFSGTIYDNLKYANDDATKEDIYRAAKMASSDHFIRTLSDGYQTVINEDASNISQGQKQLLTITRAIISNPDILILDEATSSVDTRTEKIIQDAMNELMKDRTSFVIAHRLSTIRNADLILVMDKGNIVEQGTHDELIAKQGFYEDLYNSQFSEEAE